MANVMTVVDSLLEMLEKYNPEIETQTDFLIRFRAKINVFLRDDKNIDNEKE